MTAITDIIANINAQELNLQEKLNAGREIPQPQVSFSDILASYSKQDVKSENVNSSEKSIEQENKVSKENPSEKTDRSNQYPSENVKDETSSVKKSEAETNGKNREVKDSEGSNKKNSITKKQIQNKDENLSENDGKVKNAVKKSVDTQNPKTVKKSSDEKSAAKLTEADFNRIRQIGQKAEKDESEIIEDTELQPELASLVVKNNAFSEKNNVTEEADGNDVKNTEVSGLEAVLADGDEKTDFSVQKEGKPVISKLDADGKITVRDYRQTEDTEKNNDSESKPEAKTVRITHDGNNTEVTMEIAANDAAKDTLSLNDQTAASDGSTFRAMLNNQIQANTPEFVKAGNIILKDNNQGTINLVLHPDDLGNVKIHLSMDGKTVHGQIVVNSKEALQVFKDNAESLREAFIKNGFDAANFDVSFNTASGQTGQNDSFEKQFNDAMYTGKKAYGALAESESVSTDVFEKNNFDFSNYSINIVA